MKRKRKPIFLLTILGTVAIVVAGLNMSNVVGDNKMIRNQESPNAEAFRKMKERSAANNKNPLATLTMLKNQGEQQAFNNAARAAMLGEVPELPSIEVPRNVVRNPEYQSGRTSTHWFDDESYEKSNAAAQGKTKEGG